MDFGFWGGDAATESNKSTLQFLYLIILKYATVSICHNQTKVISYIIKKIGLLILHTSGHIIEIQTSFPPPQNRPEAAITE